MNGIIEQLFKLQTAQLDHDELFHKEITRLNVHQRINHMALHFAKYSGSICDCLLNAPNESTLKKNIVDSFIISITCANTLNIRISEKLTTEMLDKATSFFALGNNIAALWEINTEDSLWLARNYPVVVGKLAKACESIDHLEPYAYRELIADNVIRICFLMLIAASVYKIDLVSEVPLRLAGVKRKSIFFDYIMNR